MSTIPIDAPLTVGREGVDLVLDDPSVSRAHVRLTPTPTGLLVEDLGSSHGTWVDGVEVREQVLARHGAIIAIGDTRLHVSMSGHLRPGPGADPRAELDGLARFETPVATIRYRPGTHGERIARQVAADAKRARSRVSGFGSEGNGASPQICLVDPFADPRGTGAIVTEGSVIDVERGEIWMVVAPETPPEPLERVFVLFFGAALDIAPEVQPLLDGYGLHLVGVEGAEERLRTTELPPISHAEGELRSLMAAAFVSFLISRDGDAAFRSFLAEARLGKVDSAAKHSFGASLAALEHEWRNGLAGPPSSASMRSFLSLSLRYLGPLKGKQAEVFVYMVLGLTFTLVFPFMTRRLFDDALPSGEMGEVIPVLLVMGAAFAISLLADLRRTYVSAYVSGAIVRDVRQELFVRLQALDSAWYQRHTQGDVMSRLFSDVTQVEAGLSQTLRDGLLHLLSIAVSATVMMLLDPLLGVIVLIAAPLVAIVYRTMGAGARVRSTAVQRAASGLLGVSAENYDAQPVVKTFGLEDREEARFLRASERLFAAERRMVLFGGVFSLSVNVIVTALRLLILGLGAWLILEGRLTIGGLVAFLGVMGEVINPVTQLTSIGQALQASTGALIRVNEVIDAEPEVADRAAAATLQPLSDAIDFSGVGFSYTPTHQVLSDVDLTIPAGSRVALVGPSGSGKSTVLRLLMRLADPSSGAVHVDGVDVRDVELASLRAQTGVVFQDSFLFDTTIRENIALGRPGATDDEVLAAAAAAEVDSFAAMLPSGYDTMVGERGTSLSGGQRQRVAIARALLRDPRLLLLDEATSALDPGTERQIVETLQRVGEGRTTVAVTHRLTSVIDYDLIYVLVEGRVAERGTHDSLLAAGGTYARLWAEQTGVDVPPAIDRIAALSKVPVFAELDAEQLAPIAARLRASHLAPGHRMGEGDGQLALLERGRVRVIEQSGDRHDVVAELGPGDWFGLRALLGHASTAFIEAVEPTDLLIVPDDLVRASAAEHPSVALALSGGSSNGPAGGQVVERSATGLWSVDGTSAETDLDRRSTVVSQIVEQIR